MKLRYAAIGLLLALAGFIDGDLMGKLVRALLNPAAVSASPFTFVVGTRTISAGPLAGDQVLAVEGRPLHSVRQLTAMVAARRPGDTLRFTLSEPSGRAVEREVPVPSQKGNFATFIQIALAVALRLLVPLVGLGLGFGVVLIRPRDWNAWLVLFLMLGFIATVHPPDGEGAIPDLTIVWSGFWNTLWPVGLMLFGIYFPNRSLRDKRWPWIKYIAGLFFVTSGLFYWIIFLVWQHDINASASLSSAALELRDLQVAAWLMATAGFLLNIRIKRRAESSPDGRRRLTILHFGAWAGLGPVACLALLSMFLRRPLFETVPAAVVVSALLFLPIFPIALGYVIVVERAMDLRFVIRMGVKYGMARLGLWALRTALLSLVASVVIGSWRRGLSSWQPLELSGYAAVLLLVRKPIAEKATNWVDKKFFREAYDAERVLSGLASEVGRYLEVQPLLERVAVRLGDTLHVTEIVILLREGDTFRTSYSTRRGEPMDIPANSRIVLNLEKRAEPLPIYFDKPPLWIRSLTAQELQTLDFMRTQLLLPVMAREGLAGIISLGPKLSEAPYSETDMRLLQAVAWQTGMALENSRLLASLASEAANRERLNYELEIAREVQERLFPQSYPPVDGLAYCGQCRPAQGIGGDYYDFLHLTDGKVGVATADVSGKGIAAALLMASLQASLRAQTMTARTKTIYGRDDLAALMTNVNRLIYEASTPSRYATCFYAEFDPDSRALSYVNAGHNAPILLRGGEVIRLQTGGVVVGLLPCATYEQGLCPLLAGDILLLFTDGISEAMTETEEEWGEDRLIAAARKYSDLEPARMIQAIFREADAFTGAARQYDDMTLVVLKVLPTPLFDKSVFDKAGTMATT